VRQLIYFNSLKQTSGKDREDEDEDGQGWKEGIWRTRLTKQLVCRCEIDKATIARCNSYPEAMTATSPLSLICPTPLLSLSHLLSGLLSMSVRLFMVANR